MEGELRRREQEVRAREVVVPGGADMGAVGVPPEVVIRGGGSSGSSDRLVVGRLCRLVAAGQAHGRVRPRAVREGREVAGVEAVGAPLGVGRLRRGPRAAGRARRGLVRRGERARLQEVVPRRGCHVGDGCQGDGACRLDSHLALQLRDVGRLARHGARVDGQGGARGGLGGRGAVLVPLDGAEGGERSPGLLDTGLVDMCREDGGDGAVFENQAVARCDHEREGVRSCRTGRAGIAFDRLGPGEVKGKCFSASGHREGDASTC